MWAVLGVILIAVFCICVVAFAAAVTWVVVKVSPTRRPEGSETPTG